MLDNSVQIMYSVYPREIAMNQTCETYIDVPNGLWVTAQGIVKDMITRARDSGEAVCDVRVISERPYREAIVVAWPDGRAVLMCSAIMMIRDCNLSPDYKIAKYYKNPVFCTSWMNNTVIDASGSRNAFISEAETLVFDYPVVTSRRFMNSESA